MPTFNKLHKQNKQPVKKNLQKRITNYSTTALSLIGVNQIANAQQFFYHDINPDVVLDSVNNPAFYALDMNNDGQTDFVFVQVNYTNSGSAVRYAIVGNYSVNAELGSTMQLGTNTFGVPFALNAGDTIDYNAPEWQNFQYNIMGASIQYYSIGVLGNFPGKDKFLGVKFFGPTENGIGWIRCEMDSQSFHLILKDYAYSTDTETPILAGQMFPTNAPIMESQFGVKYFYVNQTLHVNLAFANSATLIITNVEGQVIDNAIIHEGKNEISLSGLPTGIYFIEVVNQNQIEQGKFLIK